MSDTTAVVNTTAIVTPASVIEQPPVCTPFVKWAGGKRQLLKELDKHVPKGFEKYYEPFLGGGAFFFYLASVKQLPFTAHLSDINEDLINAYRVVKDNVEQLIIVLGNHQAEYKKSPKEFYYSLRARSGIADDVERAARFITLNRTCYNGLYRVNKKGLFNVPMGEYRNPTICDSVNLRKVSAVLQRSNAIIAVNNYKQVLQGAKAGDFVYIDPPYKPTSVTASFTAFTSKGFNDKDQKALHKVFISLDKKGCKVMLSNSNVQFIRTLYKDYKSTTTQVKSSRAINSNAGRRKGHTELIVRNYNA